MRGEKFKQATDALSRLGSPPHARGKAEGKLYYIRKAGITPACAGKSFGIRTKKSPRRDHPRMRGEKRICRVPATKMLGSPPHARGKGGAETERGRSGGITPACAGKRQNNPYTGRPIRDHPRMRGEKFMTSQRGADSRGSPPHARGKGADNAGARRGLGITPACAGKRPSKTDIVKRPRDHPRMRGEKCMCG